MTKNIQIGLAIGNSRYHWAWFLNTQIQSTWDTSYLTTDILSQMISGSIEDGDRDKLFPTNLQQAIAYDRIEISQIPIYLCSVVPSQTIIWQQLPQVRQITLADIPLQNLYPTLGIDRALALFGAGETYGYPILVIDGGTALTITGVDENHRLIGGAIMPGLRLQLRSLFSGTAALPEIGLPPQLPPRWSDNTENAIASGILHTISSGIRDFIADWQQLHPQSKIILTGGDGANIIRYLQPTIPSHLVDRFTFDSDLLFRGFSAILHSSFPLLKR